MIPDHRRVHFLHSRTDPAYTAGNHSRVKPAAVASYDPPATTGTARHQTRQLRAPPSNVMPTTRSSGRASSAPGTAVPPPVIVDVAAPAVAPLPPAREAALNITELKDMTIQKLTQIAKDLNVDGATGMRKQDLIFQILRRTTTTWRAPTTSTSRRPRSGSSICTPATRCPDRFVPRRKGSATSR
jgi:hypothetical protein